MKCFNCEKQAQFKCDCDHPFFCHEHVGLHMMSFKNHHIGNIDIEIEDQRLRISKARIFKRLEKIEEAKADITSKSKALISLIGKLSCEAILQLDSIAKKLLILFQEDRFCKSDIEELERINSEDIKIHPFFIEGIWEEIDSNYKKDFITFEKISDHRRSEFLGKYSGGFLCGAVTQDCRLLVTGGKDSTIRGWSLKEKNQVFVLTGHKRDVICIDLSDNSKYIASGSSDNSVQVWDIQSKVNLGVSNNESEVRSIRFLENQSLIAFALSIGLIKIWNIKDKKICFNHNSGYATFSFHIKKNYSLFILGSSQNFLVYNLNRISGFGQENLTCNLMKNFNGHTLEISCFIITLNETIMVSGSKDKLIKIWNLGNFSIKFTLAGSNDNINSLAFTANEEELVSGCSDHSISIWSMTTGNLIKQYNNLESPILSILKFKEDFISLSDNSKIGLFNLNDKEIATIAFLKTYKVDSLKSTFDKNLLGYVSDKRGVVWDLDQDKEKYSLTPNKDQVLYIEISENEKNALTCSEGKEKNLFYWDLKLGQLIGELQGHTDSVLCACISTNSIYALSGSCDKTVRLWNLETLVQEYEFKGHTGNVISVKFIKNDEFFVSHDSNNLTVNWNIKNKANDIVLNLSDSGINPRPDLYGSSYGAPSTQIGNGTFNIGHVSTSNFRRGGRRGRFFDYRNPY